MATAPTPGPSTLEHRFLRAALEFAVGLAEAGQKRKPPLPYPADLKPFFRQHRLAGATLGRVRRVIGADFAI